MMKKQRVDFRSAGFWTKLNELSEQLVDWRRASKLLKLDTPGAGASRKLKPLTREEILIKIQTLIEEFLQDVAEGRLPKFVLSSCRNTAYVPGEGVVCMADVVDTSEVSLGSRQSMRRYACMMSCLTACYKLVSLGKHSTKRDVYYGNVKLFGSQRAVDNCVTDISRMLDVPRNQLNILATSKGLVYGHLCFTNVEGAVVNCAEQVVQIPNLVDSLNDIRTTARYVLVVEKEATFQRLAEHRLQEKLGPSLLITGKGFPDISTRQLVHRLSTEHSVPVFALCDADPYGIEIVCVYKYGSQALSQEAENLTCPDLRWIGIHPKDVNCMRVQPHALIPLTQNDTKKARGLLARAYVTSAYAEQINLLLERKSKAEIECLDSISQTYMSDIYLPLKIRTGDWI